MPNFFYRAKTSPHKIIEGSIEAESQAQAVNKLIKQGYFPISVEEVVKESFSCRQRTFFFKKVSARDLHIFTHQLSSLIGSGLTLLSALNTIISQTQNRYLKSVLSDVISKIKDGRSFFEALSNWPNVFSHLFVAMVKSAEIGGNLDEVLKRLEDYSSKEQELRANIREALVYPFFIAVISIFTILILLGFVIPRLTIMFKEMGEVLPLPTRMLIATSGFLKNYGWLILVIIFVIIFIFMRRLKSPESRFVLDRLKLKFPLLGRIIQKIEISRFSRTLSTLLFSGVPVVPALEITQGVVNNVILREEIKGFQDKIREGANFSNVIKSSPYFPVFMTNIISVGEEAGALEGSFLRIADEYTQEAENTLKTLTKLLEPTVILIMGLIVGFIVISMLLPIFQINLIVR